MYEVHIRRRIPIKAIVDTKQNIPVRNIRFLTHDTRYTRQSLYSSYHIVVPCVQGLTSGLIIFYAICLTSYEVLRT